jgi:hypothetical protein
VPATLALAGGLVCIARLNVWWQLGGWPPHDSAAYWLAGIHLREGAPVYGAVAGDYLAFLYGPPWAVVFAVLSVLPLHLLAAGLLIGQVLGLRYVLGDWMAVGLVSWLPVVGDELSIGNIDFIMAAVILAGVTRAPRSGAAIALFTFAKFSPFLVLSRQTWREAAIVAAVLILLTLPWWHLWPEWIGMLSGSRDSSLLVVPILPRIPVVIALLLLRRQWSTAAAAALATPALYFHSLILFLPAARLWLTDARRSKEDEPLTEPLAVP